MENENKTNATEIEVKNEKLGFAKKLKYGLRKVAKGIVKAAPYILTSALSFGAGVLVGMANKDNDEGMITEDVTDDTDIDNSDAI